MQFHPWICPIFVSPFLTYGEEKVNRGFFLLNRPLTQTYVSGDDLGPFSRSCCVYKKHSSTIGRNQPNYVGAFLAGPKTQALLIRLSRQFWREFKNRPLSQKVFWSNSSQSVDSTRNAASYCETPVAMLLTVPKIWNYFYGLGRTFQYLPKTPISTPQTDAQYQ